MKAEDFYATVGHFTFKVFKTADAVYLRMHGRSGWYAHDYSVAELNEVVSKIKAIKPKEAYVFFNNDHAMLENAREMLKGLEEEQSFILPNK